MHTNRQCGSSQPANRRLNRKKALLLAGLVLVVAALFIYAYSKPGVPSAQPAGTPDGDPGYEAWQQDHRGAAVVCWGQGDLNADGQYETVLIYELPAGAADPETSEPDGSASQDAAGDDRADESNIKEVKPDRSIGEKRWMTVILAEGGRYIYTEPERAPVSNQTIEFRDIDEKAPAELIISGSKGTDVGYAVYRLTGEELKNLFGEGMDKCC